MSLPIVGSVYRPPAKALLSVLPAGTTLLARPEPENPHDPNAIMIVLRSSDIPHSHAEAIATAVAGFGFTSDEIFSRAEWHVGYLPAKLAIFIAPKMENKEHEGKLTFDLAGKPKIDLPIGNEVGD